MAERFQIPWPMWRVQYELLGGGRKIGAVTVACALAVVGGILGIRRLYATSPFTSIAGGILNTMTALMVGMLILGGCSAIHRALLRDYESKMRESHRLSPMSSLTVIVGYLFGATLQVLPLFFVFMLIGVGVTLSARLPVRDWVLGNLLLLNGTITLWAATLFAGMRMQKPLNPAPLLVIIGALTVPFWFVPAAGLLFNTYAVVFAIMIITGSVTVAPPAVAIVVAVSMLMTVFWLWIASAKYRRPDLPALNAWRGTSLLAVTVALGAAGIVAYDQITQTSMKTFYEPGVAAVQMLATLCGALVLAAIPIGGAVACQKLVSGGTAARNWTDRISATKTAILAALLICALMALIAAPVWPQLLMKLSPDGEQIRVIVSVWAYTLAAFLITTLTLVGIFRLTTRLKKSGNAVAGGFIIFFWIGLPAADLIRAEYMRDYRNDATYSWILGGSPMGTFAVEWYQVPVPTWPGIALQVALLALVTVFAIRAAGDSKPALPTSPD